MIHPHDVNERVAALIRSARTDAGLTQAELAERAGLRRASIANIEIGIQSVSVHQLLSMASALRISPQRLLPALKELANENDPESRRLKAAYETVLSSQ
jgi:transcriptional regulator with XRE-family HTH domain